MEIESFVGLKPAREWTAEGAIMELVVSVPMAIEAKFAARAAPLPELEPSGDSSMGAKGLWG